jgi:hypothetical protein
MDVCRFEAGHKLLNRIGSDNGGGDDLLIQQPGQRHLQGLNAPVIGNAFHRSQHPPAIFVEIAAFDALLPGGVGGR